MSETTNISWTDATWNPWRGCTKVSPGCTNCYAEKVVTGRLRPQHVKEAIKSGKWAADSATIPLWGKGAPRIRAAAATFNAPLRWNKKPWVCDGCGMAFKEQIGHGDRGSDVCATRWHRRRVFLGSLMDWLDPEVPVEWLADALQVIRECHGIAFLCLTKRPEHWRSQLAKAMLREQYTKLGDWCSMWLCGTPPPNIWLGVSVEDQKRADERIPELLNIPAKVRFVSAEPLLGQLDLQLQKNQRDQPECQWTSPLPFLDWVIVGGESGFPRRNCGVEAIIHVAEQCQAAGVPCFVKQDCASMPGTQKGIPDKVWKLKQFPTLSP